MIVADTRLKSSQKFIKDQMTERETEREEFDDKLEVLKCQLKEKERESLDTEDLRSHVFIFYSVKLNTFLVSIYFHYITFQE